MSYPRKSKFPLSELIKSLAPITWMGRLMVAGVVVWFIDWVFVEGETLFGSRSLKTFVDVASALAFIPIAYFLIRGARWGAGNLLWRVRRRLIVTYLLVGALPLLLMVALLALVLLVVLAQSSVNLVGRQLDGYLEQSQAAAQAIGHNLSHLDAASFGAERLRRRLQERADSLGPIFPDVTLIVRQSNGGGGASEIDGYEFNVTVSGPASENVMNGAVGDDPPPPAPTSTLPQWLLSRLDLDREFHGLVVNGDRLSRRRVHAMHVIKLERQPAAIFQLSYPISENLCAHLSHTTDLDVKPATANFPLIMTPRGPQPDVESGERAGGGQGGWPIFKPIAEWQTGEGRQNEALRVDPSFIQPARIYQRIQQFKSGSAIGGAVVFGLAVLVVFFLLITLAAVVYAVVLTSSITGAVHNLYEGTMKVEAGDFDHEIPITGRDQLAGLTRSFNRMTGSVRELLRVSAEKQRLDQEMKIAAAVQSRLFPRSIPNSERLDIAKGVCIPARSVSGDYYDLLDVAPGVIGVVVADVCGKGVSAALMMANLQANLRGQAQARRDTYKNGVHPIVSGDSPARRVVERVNQQVAGSMMDASFITLFYAEFDERRSTLRYTNAGHNPPLVFSDGAREAGRVRRLDVGGTVLGLFCNTEFEEEEIELRSGDTLVAFTDGLIEARSPLGEEFGEDRLIEVLLENAGLPAAGIESRILRAVEDWTAEAEQEDDLTLLILKVK